MRTSLLAIALFTAALGGTARAATVRLVDHQLRPALPMPAAPAVPPTEAHPLRFVGGTGLVLLGASGVVSGGFATFAALTLLQHLDGPELGGLFAFFIGVPLLSLGVPLVALGIVGVITGVELISTSVGSGGDAPALEARPVPPTDERRGPPAFTPVGWSGNF